jgi:hypothetical protein
MTDPALIAVEALFTEPTFGIPLLLTLAALATWILAAPPPADRRPAVLRRSWSPPRHDLSSRMYFALADQRYSEVLGITATELDATVRKRRGVSVYDLPWWRPRAAAMGIPEAADLRRCLRAITTTQADAIEREGRFFIRWRFWRSREADEALFLARVDRTIESAATWIATLEQNA